VRDGRCGDHDRAIGITRGAPTPLARRSERVSANLKNGKLNAI